MVKKSKGKHRLDKFYHLAKEQGYRSRAAFKLVQLNRQFHFLDRARTCLDLCAAPGGWLQVAVKTMPINSLVIGIDLDPIRAIRGVKTIIGDITTAKARAAIKKESNGSMMEVVLHDGAPNVGGAWASEAYSQSALVLEALRLATDTLVPKGTFVTKIFRSQDYNALLYAFKQLFTKVEATKPAASRNTSAEIFVVCQGYKAPAKIDPRLLDPKHLFQEVSEPVKVMGPDALLKQKVKQKRFRDGYAEGLSTLHRQTSVAAFIASDNPVEMLGQYTRFVLDDQIGQAPLVEEDREEEGEEEKGGKDLSNIARIVRSHPGTNLEIRTLLGDLQVLGRSEFKQLLKWRLKVKKDLAAGAAASKQAAETPEQGEEDAGKQEEDEEDAVLAEMAEVKERAAQRQRREKKRRLESKKKSRIRAAQLALSEGINEEGQEQLFSLAAVKGPVKAAELGESAVPDEDAAEELESERSAESSEEDLDSDEEQMRYEADQEEALEEAYQGYLQRQGQRAQAARAKRARLGKGDLSESEEEAEGGSDEEALPVPTLQEEPEEGGGLLVTLDQNVGRATTADAVAAQWFSQDLFAGADASDDDSEEGAPPAKRSKSGTTAGKPEAAPVLASVAAKGEEEAAAPSGKAGTTRQPVAPQKESEGFEEVPMSDSDRDSDSASDTEMEEPDEQAAAEIRAIAKIMLHGRARNDIQDAGYHRFAFHDTHLPKWFAEDERRHMKPPAVVTKEDVEAEKARVRAIDARPIKKIAEAKARKRKRLQVRLEAANSKASAIVEQDDLSGRAKAKEVAKLYAKAKDGKGKKKGKPSRGDKYKKKGPPLDRRMMSDKRPVGNKAKKAAAKSRSKKGGGKNMGGGLGKAKSAKGKGKGR